jgi:hypothetical protein
MRKSWPRPRAIITRSMRASPEKHPIVCVPTDAIGWHKFEFRKIFLARKEEPAILAPSPKPCNEGCDAAIERVSSSRRQKRLTQDSRGK